MKKFLLFIGLCLTIFQLSAQDEAIFMHYTISPILINPAAAGFQEAYQLQFNARAQWTGFKDSPKTIGARFNGPVGRTFGIGAGVLSEQAAQLSRVKLQLDYAFRFSIQENWKLAFGFSTEFQRMQVDNEIVNSPFFDAQDDLLDDLLNGKGEFDAAVGLYGTYRENTFAGFTFNNLVSNRLAEIAQGDQRQSFFNYYTLNFGHRFILDDLGVTLEPSVLMRQIRNAPFQMDLNMKAGFLDDQLVAGLSYRSLGVAGILLGAKLSNFNLFYSYDLSFQRFQQYNSGSHEVTIALSLKKKEQKRK